MSPAKTSEPIEMPFGMWTSVGPRNHVLVEGSDLPREEAVFWGTPYLLCGLLPKLFDHL